MTCPHCNMPKTKIVICDTCPCLNKDNEDGCSCNLGYNSRMDLWIGYSKFCDGKHHSWSDRCKLEKIIDDGNDLFPVFYSNAKELLE